MILKLLVQENAALKIRLNEIKSFETFFRQPYCFLVFSHEFIAIEIAKIPYVMHMGPTDIHNYRLIVMHSYHHIPNMSPD